MRPHAIFVVGAAFLMALAAASCTRTIYVVQNSDGSFTEVDDSHERFRGQTHHGTVLEDDAVAIDVLTSNDYVLVEDEDGRLYLQIEIEGQEIEIEDRAAFNMAIVIDRSGSMQGRKLEDARRAAIWLVRHLADGDQVAIISYASDVTVDVPTTVVGPRTRGRLEHAIERLYAAGGTYLSGGLEAGAEEVRSGYHAASLNRVILLSDGNANVGVTDVYSLEAMGDRLREEGISVSTMGMGLDYNEDIMATVALAGAGNYYFIERSSDLESIFGTELGALASTVARDTVLELEVPHEVIIEDIYGYRHERSGRNVRVFMNSVAAGEKRRMLMSLRLPRHHRGAYEVARGQLSYRDEVKKRQRSVRLPPVQVTYTGDNTLVRRSVKRRVVEKLEAVRNAQVRQEVMRRLDRGDQRGAQQVVRERRAANRRMVDTYGGAALKKEAASLYDFDEEVQAAPAPGSTRYKRMKKARKAEAVRSLLY